MILVLSQKDEKSTDEVLIEMRYLGIDFIRINEDDMLRNLELHLINQNFDLSFSVNNRKVLLSEITGFWYRRGRFNFRFNETLLDTLLIDDFILYRQYIDQEFEHITALLKEHLKQIPHINSFDDNFNSKMTQLYWAAKLGLKIPDTSILNNKSSLMKFFNDSENGIILKNIRTNSFKKYFETSTRYYITNHITPVTEENIKQSSDSFLPTKFQKYTDKKFEIRSFFIKENFYSMAIFSQQNEQTKLDFRNYDYSNPNRNVPFQLPKSIESKLKKLMKRLNLNSGSIDLIYTNSSKFIFLEVNPIGQFDWLSKECNYNIPNLIAKQFQYGT